MEHRRPRPALRHRVGRHLVALPALLAAGLAGGLAAAQPIVENVDPFIGTGGHGHTYPGANVPFGMVQLSPDTRLTGWDGCSGYHFSDDVVYGFSHTHLSGTGVSDYGDVLLMPGVGEVRFDNGASIGPESGYASRFDKSEERARAGWYSVRLEEGGIEVDLTATERTGLHRYRFPAEEPAWVVLDLRHRDTLLDSSVRFVDERTVAGHRRSKAWAADQVVYFHAEFSRPFEVLPHEGEANEGAVLHFGAEGGELLVKVGISAVDAEGARRNLEAEQPDFDFEATRAQAEQAWEATLGRVAIEGATQSQRRTFYTALYHSLLAPHLYSDVDGRYRGMDGKIHAAEGRRHYTVFSLWDTFRATHPLLTVLEPERSVEFVRTFLAQYEQGGRLPVWELAANETDCMIGYHSVSVIADAYRKDLRGFDARLALEAMIDSAERDHFGLDSYKELGFVAADRESESVSKTLEYAYDDWCIARMAEELGETEIAARFDRRSAAWRHLLDPQTLHMRARMNQRWLTPFDPRRVDFHYTEANAWQYRFFAPHHAADLVEAMGGDRLFVARLDSLFAADSATTGRDQADITGLIGQYAHGNEPSHHVAWLGHYAGRPDWSARRVREILDELYRDTPDGLAGNEDCGQMSSWYVLAAMGLYQVAPGSNEWLLAPPLFDSVSVELGEGRTFTVTRRGPRDPDAVIVGATWNGQKLQRSYLRHEEIAGGGRLEVETSLGASGWGRAPESRPGREHRAVDVLPAPYLVAETDRFRDRLQFRLACADPDAEIFYSLEGEDVFGGAPADGPIEIDRTTSLRFLARDGQRRSPLLRATLTRISHDWTVRVESEPNSQYTAGGPEALIDGRRGPDDWRTGSWLGYQGQDFVATLDFGEVQSVQAAGASFLQDMRSWIWMPRELTVSTSVDGVRFVDWGSATLHDVPVDREGVFRRDFWITDDSPREARYLRFYAPPYGTIPEWHPGAGGESFIFVDELLVEEVP